MLQLPEEDLGGVDVVQIKPRKEGSRQHLSCWENNGVGWLVGGSTRFRVT